jgi:glycosyltransferase involved in cell wall biosynthesis
MNVGKIGIGILTFNREKYFKQVYKSLKDCVFDELVIVNDGKPYNFKPTKGDVIQHEENKCIAASKNDALKFLLQKNCDHLFLIEDDILVKDRNVFKEYISVANETGLYHLNFEQAAPNHHQYTINYKDGIAISLWKDPQGAFSYFRSEALQKVGLFDEAYKNAFEHIDLAYRFIAAKLLPAFWYFPDIANATDFLEPIKGSSENSTITNKENYQKNWDLSAKHFIQKFGHFTNQIQEANIRNVTTRLGEIYNNRIQDETQPNNLFLQPA